MATTVQMFLVLIALVINTAIIGMLYFVSNVVLAPLFSALEKIIPAGQQAIPISQSTYIIPAIWAILLAMEIIIIIAGFVVIGRSSVIDD